MGILPAVSDAQTLILADKLVHASIIDGIRLSTARCIRFRHNDLVQLERLLEQHHATFRQLIIVTESIFSMDGDQADLTALVRLKKILQRTALCGRSPCIRRKGTARSGLRRRNRMHPGYRFPRGHLLARQRRLPAHTSPAAGRYASISSTGCEPSSSPRHCLRQVLPGHCLSYGNLPECRTTASIWQESAGHCAKHYKPRGTDAPAQAISSH